ncbi:hypothetical protein DO97_10820 [Neosynechococcus sphagnicola sy1]|uniref:Uncharacterized protein n=1 Tax=Neosynechococcus sphagnicola sy1 TaxID=1497020 RepID=A0A098TKC1_9CYAN|nr:hypothetical protein [Neosynechococcus sphagnicola]KGF72292.1 hypothetical protein DO97_10820 [Neosynechococcus sphagnicola sy1]
MPNIFASSGSDLDTLLEQVRPEELDQIQIKLHMQDIAYLQQAYPTLIAVNCIACDSPHYHIAFEKLRYTFNRCDGCDSLFISPRLSREALAYFFPTGHLNEVSCPGIL